MALLAQVGRYEPQANPTFGTVDEDFLWPRQKVLLVCRYLRDVGFEHILIGQGLAKSRVRVIPNDIARERRDALGQNQGDVVGQS